MLDLTPDRSGVIPSEYALRYKELGDFIRSCYGNPIIPSFQNSSIDFLLHIQMFKSTVSVDRSVIQEAQTNGQVIRGYTVDALVAISKDKNECVSKLTVKLVVAIGILQFPMSFIHPIICAILYGSF
jgi:hypothetical protein